MKPFLIAFAAACLFAGMAWRGVARAPYVYDEADYQFAASLGWAANYTDSPTLPFRDFLSIGLGRGRGPAGKEDLSSAIRGGNDVVFYRHWHGPLYFYWLILLRPIRGDEFLARAAGLLFPILLFFGCYAGTLWIAGRKAWPAALLAGCLVLFNDAALWSTEIAPHQLYALLATCSLLCLVKAIRAGSLLPWYAATVLAALAFCTLEISFTLLACLIVAAYLARTRLGLNLRGAGISALLFTVTVVAVWPGAILKLSFLKAYLFMGYLALGRKSAWGGETLADVWESRFAQMPFEWLLIVAALLVFLARPKPRTGGVMLGFALLSIAGIARVNSSGTRYSLVFLPALLIFAAWQLAPLLARRSVILAPALCVMALVAQAVRPVPPRNDDPRLRSLIAETCGNAAPATLVRVPQNDLPMLHYYCPQAALSSYTEPPPPPAP